MLIIYLVVVLTTCVSSIVSDDPVLFGRRSTSIDEDIFKDDGINYRLPNDTRPETYEIAIRTRVDVGDFDFNGTVRIGIVVVEKTRTVVVHVRKLTIVDVSLWRYVDGKLSAVPIQPFQYDVVTEFLTITSTVVDFDAGERLSLVIDYSGEVSDEKRGFYRSSYRLANGTQV